MANQKFSCASISGGACPSGIARLFIVNRSDPEKSGVCSGFMITRNRLITNHHCLSTQAECNNTYIAVYNGSSYLSTRCRRLIRAQEDSENTDNKAIDVAELEIDDIFTGGSFDISATRAVPGDKVTAWVVDHTGLDLMFGNLFDSRITEYDCEAVSQNESPSLLLQRCPVIQGNSGSPAFNEEGQVIGVIWGATATFDTSLSLNSRRLRNEKAAVTEMIYFFK
jgi:V8-like Glu-specific endopeptidase